MCGRFALYTPPARLARYFGATLAGGTDSWHEPSWNVAPTDEVLGVRDRPPAKSAAGTAGTGDDAGARDGEAPAGAGARDGEAPTGATPERVLMTFRWGLVPWWSKDATTGSRLFNARRETLATKASFREAFRQRRIIVPADGFYEWRTTKTGRKEPHYFARADGAPLAFAGLAERWRPKGAPRDSPPLRSCTIVTTPAGQDMAGIHDRQPVVLDPATFDLWLDPRNEDTEELRALLGPPPPGTLVHYAVGTRVGSVRNNDRALIEPA